MTETRVPRRPSAGRATDQDGVVPEADMRPGVSSAAGSAKPWLKATALVTVSASGVVTGMTIAPGPTAALTSPAGVPASLPAGLQSALQARLLADRTPAATAAPAAAPAATAASAAAVSETSSQQAFIGAVAPGAIAAEQQYGAVTTAFSETAKPAIAHLEPLYREVATRAGISWKVLAACDWMQCRARPRYSPVYREKLGTVNPDGSCYATKSQALARCAADLTELASAVYGIDLTVKQPMSVRTLAEVFAAYRWGGILVRHSVSAMEFPYSVAGLTAAHTGMRWPAISDPDAPDRPGAKFRQSSGAVPVVLRLGYPATV